MENKNKALTQASHHQPLISHGSQTDSSFDDLLQQNRLRLQQTGDLPGATVEQQISLLDSLAEFELGRFLLENHGLNAYWTHQLVTYRSEDAATLSMTSLEKRLFDHLPAALATRERFGIFRTQLQSLLKPRIALASVPCGLMGELLLLDYQDCPDVHLIGIDLDQQALDSALALAKECELDDRLSLHCEDAWASDIKEQFDVVTSNGLNIYEPDDARVIELYCSFFRALKPGGTLVTSFMTPPPPLSPESPWIITAADSEYLALQQLLFLRIIEAKWNSFRTHEQTTAQLSAAGFVDIQFHDDRARMFPTVVARKPL